MSLSYRFFFVRRLIAALGLFGMLAVCSACSDDDSSSPSIFGSWSDGYGGTLTISSAHFSIVGDGFFGPWKYSGTIETLDYSARCFVFRYTNAGTLAAGQDIVGRYNKIVWKNFSVSGGQAIMEYQELYDAVLTNSAGKFIAWPTKNEALTAITNSDWYTTATNISYQR